jgi:iron complex outermembrane receptor protein
MNLGNVNRYIFQGMSVDGAPTDGKTKAYEYDFNLTHYFTNDKTFKLNVYLNHNYREYEEANKYEDGGVFIVPIYQPPPSPNTPIFYKEKRVLKKYGFYLGKEFNTKRNSLLTAVSVKQKFNDVKENKYRTLIKDMKDNNFLTFDKETIYSLILENQFNITEKNLLFTSLKVDKYQRNGNYDDFTDFIARLGIISSPYKNWFIKGFITRTYVPPSFFETELSPMKQLNQEVLTGGTFEIINETKKHRFSFLAGYVNIQDLITYGEAGTYNLPNDVDSILTSIDYEYRFNYNTKILLNYNKTFYEDDFASSKEAGYIQLFKRAGKFDFYGGLFFKKGFKIHNIKVKDSYDLSLGVSYNITKTFSFKFKGENLLNNSLRVIYFTPFEVGTYDSLERKYFFSFEKVF